MTDEEKQYLQQFAQIRQAPLAERLESCAQTINDLWADNRISEAIFLGVDTTLRDAMQEIEALRELLKLHAPKALQKFEEVKSRMDRQHL